MSKNHKQLLNRELSWIEFNQRVLDEAGDESVPLLERVKFLAITSSNLDEFFMVRVGGLRELVAHRKTRRDPSGMTPGQQLTAVGKRLHEMVKDQYALYLNEIEPMLASHGVARVAREDVSGDQLSRLERVFDESIYPVVTPMALHPGDPFPLLRNLSLHVLVRLKPAPGTNRPRFALVPVEQGLERFVRLRSENAFSYILIEDVVALFVERLFPGDTVMETAPFRLTRNADMSVQEDRALDLLSGMQDVLAARKTSDGVRLEISSAVSAGALKFLTDALKVDSSEIYRVPGPLDLKAYMKIGALDGFNGLAYESWPPVPVPEYDPKVGIFEQLRRRDILLSHPYESFDPVVRLVEEAADDPDVLAIKQILYRTSRNSPIVTALMRAAENGKYVTVICELKARFDEAQNIEWAQALERAGVQLIYGIKGYKTHAKMCLILRRESDGLRRYLHAGTGNYNESTARLYSDISYMTCNEDLGSDASVFFNTITGFTQPQRFHTIDAAPIGMRDRFLELIDGEIERKRQGQKAGISIKINSLVDAKLIDALYRASQKGVKIRINVRGICCLRPGVEGLSENISVISIVDRYLEHSRIFYFYHGGEELVFISSADWMPRNLDRRIELLIPIDDKACKRRIIDTLETYFRDTVKARQLMADGSYETVRPVGRRKRVRSQEALYQASVERRASAMRSEREIFQPHLPQDTGTTAR